jgi:hypothetical protein
MKEISIGNYGNYRPDNNRTKCMKIHIGSLTLWFSYRTIVAFKDENVCNVIIVSENAWTRATGKHLNWIDGGDKKSRLPRKTFEELMYKCLEEHDLIV